MELQHAVLGLLSIRPMSGYDLGRAFAGSVAHFWHADQSQIYRTIDRLATKSLITTEVIPQNGTPDRKVHALTAAGHDELNAWLSSPLETPRPKLPLLARLFFIGPLGPDAVEELFDQATHQLQHEIEELGDIVTGPTDDPAGLLRAATLNYGRRIAEAELDWLRDTREQFSALQRTDHEPP